MILEFLSSFVCNITVAAYVFICISIQNVESVFFYHYVSPVLKKFSGINHMGNA